MIAQIIPAVGWYAEYIHEVHEFEEPVRRVPYFVPLVCFSAEVDDVLPLDPPVVGMVAISRHRPDGKKLVAGSCIINAEGSLAAEDYGDFLGYRLNAIQTTGA